MTHLLQQASPFLKKSVYHLVFEVSQNLKALTQMKKISGQVSRQTSGEKINDTLLAYQILQFIHPNISNTYSKWFFIKVGNKSNPFINNLMQKLKF